MISHASVKTWPTTSYHYHSPTNYLITFYYQPSFLNPGKTDGRKKKVVLKRVKAAEQHIHSKVLGILGGIDVLFEADFYPDVVNAPEHMERQEVIVELKTGWPQVKHEHQVLCYMMLSFGVKLFGNVGFVLYSNFNDKKEYTLRVIEPGLRDFMQMVSHRNGYLLDPQFYQEYAR